MSCKGTLCFPIYGFLFITEVPKLTVFVFSINFVVILCHFSCTSWQSSSIFLLDVLKYGVVVLAGARRFSHMAPDQYYRGQPGGGGGTGMEFSVNTIGMDFLFEGTQEA